MRTIVFHESVYPAQELIRYCSYLRMHSVCSDIVNQSSCVSDRIQLSQDSFTLIHT